MPHTGENENICLTTFEVCGVKVCNFHNPIENNIKIKPLLLEMKFVEYSSEPRYMSKLDDGMYDSECDNSSNEAEISTLVEYCIKGLTGKQKTQLALLGNQYPKIYEFIMNEVDQKKEDVLDSITQLYYDQLHYRYPEMTYKNSGVLEIPLLKCCLMNQSIRVVSTNEPLVLNVLPMAVLNNYYH